MTFLGNCWGFFPTFPWNTTFSIPPKKWYTQQAYFIVLAQFLLLDVKQTIVTILYFFWILPSRRLHYLSRQSLPMLCHLSSTEVLSDVQRNPSVFQFVPLVLAPLVLSTAEKSLALSTLHPYIHWWKPAEPSLIYSELFHHSQLFLTGEVLQSLHYICGFNWTNSSDALYYCFSKEPRTGPSTSGAVLLALNRREGPPPSICQQHPS